ncbi:multidrug effflux MFS transporter [Empedobacter falsenii]
MKNQNKSFIWLIIFLVGFPQISETIYTPSLTLLATDYGVSNHQIQKTLGIYFIGFAIGVLLWGILSDIIGRKSSMVMGIVLYIIGSYLCLQSPSFSSLLFASFIQAIGAAAGSNVSQTILRDTFNKKERTAVFSTISAALAFSPAIGPLLGSIVASLWDVYMVFVVLILLGIIALFWSSCCLKETLQPNKKPQLNFKQISKKIINDKTFWIYGGLIGILNGIIFSYYGEAPFIFMEYFKFSMIQYGCLGCIVAFASFFGARYCKRLSSSKTNQQILYKGSLIFLLGIILYILSVLFLSSHLILTITFLLISIFIIFFGLSCMLPVCLSNALINHTDHLGISGAILGLYYYSIVGIITFIMSYIDSSFLLYYPLFLMFWFIIILLLFKLYYAKS